MQKKKASVQKLGHTMYYFLLLSKRREAELRDGTVNFFGKSDNSEPHPPELGGLDPCALPLDDGYSQGLVWQHGVRARNSWWRSSSPWCGESLELLRKQCQGTVVVQRLRRGFFLDTSLEKLSFAVAQYDCRKC